MAEILATAAESQTSWPDAVFGIAAMICAVVIFISLIR